MHFVICSATVLILHRPSIHRTLSRLKQPRKISFSETLLKDCLETVCTHLNKLLNFRTPTDYFIHSKIHTKSFYHGVISPNDADRNPNSEDPDQTEPEGAV